MPYHELNRLEAVDRFLQIKINKQEEFKEIVQLAADICCKENALITLISEDTEYILRDDEFICSSTRGESFCHYVLENDEVMVVTDSRLDSRLQNYSAVTRREGIRFYAGAPLITHDAYRLGSLCVIDQRPGDLTGLQKEMLQNLASQVIQLLEFETNLHFLKEQYLEAKKVEFKMRSFFDSTATSHLLIDKEYKILAYNKAVKTFIKAAYGVDMKVGMDIKQFINEAYMADFIENCGHALSGQSISKERQLDFAGHSLWCMLTYNPARNNNGEIVGISYNSTDITKRMEKQMAAIERQKRLDHIAFIQSHEFRRPVATIKGLLNLLEVEGQYEIYPELEVINTEMNNIDNRIAEIVGITANRT